MTAQLHLHYAEAEGHMKVSGREHEEQELRNKLSANQYSFPFLGERRKIFYSTSEDLKSVNTRENLTNMCL